MRCCASFSDWKEATYARGTPSYYLHCVFKADPSNKSHVNHHEHIELTNCTSQEKEKVKKYRNFTDVSISNVNAIMWQQLCEGHEHYSPSYNLLSIRLSSKIKATYDSPRFPNVWQSDEDTHGEAN